MDAAVVRELGKSPQCEQFQEPVAGDNEVIVHVHAASLKPVDRQLASGSHYASPREVPFICGTDGVAHLDDGRRVFFGGCRPPYGAMAQRTVVPKAFVFHVPAGVSDGLAAALPNPGGRDRDRQRRVKTPRPSEWRLLEWGAGWVVGQEPRS